MGREDGEVEFLLVSSIKYYVFCIRGVNNGNAVNYEILSLFRQLADSLQNDKRKEKIRIFWQEAHELHLIFQKITNTLDNKKLKIDN